MRWLMTTFIIVTLALTALACEEEEQGAAAPTPPATEGASPEAALTPEATPRPERSESRYSEDDMEYKLAVIDAGGVVDFDDPSIDAYARALDAAEAKCTDKRSLLGDYAVRAQQMLAEEGVDVTVLEALQAIDQSIPDESPKLNCAEIMAAWMVLMTGP
jgi:hypothetical protein